MRLLKYKRIYAVLLVPLALRLALLAQKYPGFTERYYAQGLYPLLRSAVGWVTGLIPTSLMEIAGVLLVIGLGTYIAILSHEVIVAKGRRADRILALLSTLACIASLLYASFMLFCGLNYYRESFSSLSGLPVRDSSQKELEDLCRYLVEEANELRLQVAEDENGVMRLSFGSDYEAAAYAPVAYTYLEEDYPVLSGYTPRAKPMLLSRGMSHLELEGIYSPFTFEANVNTEQPDFSIPGAMLHELAHYKGLMREDEANFAAYLAGRSSGSADFAYSGVMLALGYASNTLYNLDSDAYTEIVASSLGPGVMRDWLAYREYWSQFEGPAAGVSARVNDVYLRSNRQSEGVRSYGRMVDLLLAERRQMKAEADAKNIAE